jgi:hypothetical protein
VLEKAHGINPKTQPPPMSEELILFGLAFDSLQAQ